MLDSNCFFVVILLVSPHELTKANKPKFNDENKIFKKKERKVLVTWLFCYWLTIVWCATSSVAIKAWQTQLAFFTVRIMLTIVARATAALVRMIVTIAVARRCSCSATAHWLCFVNKEVI